MNEQSLNIRFVQEVERYPCLYNYNLTEYSRRDITDGAWYEIGREFDLSAAACKEKWKNLRAVFVRHMKPSANDPGVKKRKYYLTDFMQFVAPYVKSYSSSIPEPPEVDMTESQDTTDIAVEEDNEESNIYRPTGTQHHPTTANNTTTNTRKLKRKKTSDEVDSAIVKYLERHNRSTENTRKMFLLSLMDEVTSITDEQWKLFKRRTLNLIDEITTVKK